MPYSAPSVCHHIGCGKWAYGGHYCVDHRRNTTPASGSSQHSKDYDRHWRRLRRLHLMVNPLCVDCAKEGWIREATNVDHIKPISQGGGRLDPANLQSLCAGHHSRKTRREER